MPLFRKNALSQYIHTDCKRQLRLNLIPDTKDYKDERLEEGMPDRLIVRPGLELIKKEGKNWETQKYNELLMVFGTDKVVGHSISSDGKAVFGKMELTDGIQHADSRKFLIENQFEIGRTFVSSLGIEFLSSDYNLEFSALRPDIIEVFEANSFNDCVTPSGEILPLSNDDGRLQLRVIDVKFVAEPSKSHLAEVALYSMALAGWLIDKGLADKYVVIPNGAIWPGIHNASNLASLLEESDMDAERLPIEIRYNTLHDDLEAVPFRVFAGRIANFFLSVIPEVLDKRWDELPWHVDNRCKNCDYLGYTWGEKDDTKSQSGYCFPTAADVDHLSRVAYLTRGASTALQGQGVVSVAGLAKAEPESDVFEAHHSLLSMRYMLPDRAVSLLGEYAIISDQTRPVGSMPKWADLHVYVTVDFDLGSGITSAIGLDAFWMGHSIDPSTQVRPIEHWTEQYVIDSRSISVEKNAVMRFLARIDDILKDVHDRDNEASVQFYLWDHLQYKHMMRVIGRHLPTILINDNISYLTWLFPPEEVLSNYDLETRNSPITIVNQVIKTELALPVPHYYSIFNTARMYHHESDDEYFESFFVRRHFEDPLSDQIPSERIHEIWARGEHWEDTFVSLRETVKKKLICLKTVVRRLEVDLRDALKQWAPSIRISPPRRHSGISIDGQLWFNYAKLNATLDELDVHQTWEMPPHEREAKFRSIRLSHRLTPQEEAVEFRRLGLSSTPELRAYKMRPESREAKIHEGDLFCALAPEGWPNFLEVQYGNITQQTPLEPPGGRNNRGWYRPMSKATSVDVVNIDRESLVLVVKSNSWIDLSNLSDPSMSILDWLEDQTVLDLSSDVILDRYYYDTFTEKLKNTLHAIGNPQRAHDNSQVRMALGLSSRARFNQTDDSPAAEAIWSANQLERQTIDRDLELIKSKLEHMGVTLNESQWEAWCTSLSRRLSLIWGPPGTGKSRTVGSIILGALVDAIDQKRPIRILLTAPTYSAIDTVLLGHVYHSENRSFFDSNGIVVSRLRSSYRTNNGVPQEIDCANSTENLAKINTALANREKCVVVAATAQQVYKILNHVPNRYKGELFDLILIDEASQMDVCNAILPIASLAKNGGLVIAGDPKQLPPIHNAKPPLGLESMVESIFDYYAQRFNIAPKVLETNYRSNKEIVDLAYEAGYPRSLVSYSPLMKLNFSNPSDRENRPSGWPDFLFWTPKWYDLIDPEKAIVCFVYSEGYSGQWNQFEADVVSSLVFLLRGMIGDPLNENDPTTGQPFSRSMRNYEENEFWNKGLGIVTPHRAQQAKIIHNLQRLFSGPGVDPGLIRDAVDTVEHFQGQQRDIIIASYALGDRDIIQDEEEFIMSLNRFNVMCSRPRTKLIVMLSQELVDYLSDDIELLRQSELIKQFADTFCDKKITATLGYLKEGEVVTKSGTIKYR